MIRFIVITILVLVSSLFLSPGNSAPAGVAKQVQNSTVCGLGFTEIVSNNKRDLRCVHTVHDPIPQESAFYAPRTPAAARVPCYGDGTTGPRIQMIYGYHDGISNRAKTVVPQVQKVMAPRMQAVINAQSLGRNLGLRFAMTKGCKAIDVKVVKFPRSVQFGGDPLDPRRQLNSAADYLDKIGMNRSDRKYQILWDGFNGPACGIAFAALFPASPPTSPFSEGAPINIQEQGFVTKYSMVFNHAGGPNGPSCFDRGMSSVTTQIHELFHNLGAVQLDAPNADRGHCMDAPSVMCSGGAEGYGLGIQIPACVKVLVETLDCGMDDYWNPSPRPGSYLSTHLNVARSQFFGPQPQDLFVAAPR